LLSPKANEGLRATYTRPTYTYMSYLHRSKSFPGMLTRPGKSEAEVEAEARCYEAEARDVA